MRFLQGGRVLLVALLAVAFVAVAALPAGARPPGTNGQLTFARFNPALGDTQVYVVNPDGTGERLIQGADGRRREPAVVPGWRPHRDLLRLARRRLADHQPR